MKWKGCDNKVLSQHLQEEMEENYKNQKQDLRMLTGFIMRRIGCSDRLL
jgi:hypothetical protein